MSFSSAMGIMCIFRGAAVHVSPLGLITNQIPTVQSVLELGTLAP
jgi:hypothetical protein